MPPREHSAFRHLAGGLARAAADLLALPTGSKGGATIGPSHLLGEMAFLDGQTRSATAIAAKDTTLLVPKLLPGLIRLLILRLRRTNVKLVDRVTD